MSNLRLQLGRAVQILALVAVLLARMAPAQTAAPTAQDPFAALHDGLVTATDVVLAEALRDRPWLKTAEPGRDMQPPTAAQRAERVSAAVQRVQQLRPRIDPILRAEGVPPELIAVALVESGGRTMAASPKGARGVWQFMPETARRYGLVVSAKRDERVELEKSTGAASRYLRDLYRQFGDWPLALAAYNAGEQAVERAVGRSGRQDYLTIARLLPLETRNYVPAVLESMNLFSPGGLTSGLGKAARPSRSIIYASAQAGR